MNTDTKILAEILGKYLATKADSIRQELEGIDEAVNELGKIVLGEEPEKAEKPTEAQFNGLPWQPKEGMKGSYEQAENDNSENFRSVQQYVKSLSGFCHLHGFKVFFHYKDEKLIDRKK